MPEKKNIDEISEMTLEDAMRRLDAVVKALDGDNIDLDSSLRLYEEGVRLVRICTEKLADAERRIKILKMNPDGEIVEADFSERITGAQA